MTTLELTLHELPPSLNNLYATVFVKGKPRRVLSSDARAWKSGAAWEIAVKAREDGAAFVRGEPLDVAITLSAPDCGRWDLDGRAKLLLDALCEALGVDDRAVQRLTLEKRRAPVQTVLRVAALRAGREETTK